MITLISDNGIIIISSSSISIGLVAVDSAHK
jgi:hypothetical protein